MRADLAGFLRGLRPLVEETAVWGNGRLPLAISYYLSQELPPLAYVSSVRAVVWRRDEVLAVLEPSGEYYITPGGRCEAGEAVEQTLQREVLEETGWMLADVLLLGVIHFHHLAPRPADYLYPYPDFLQLVYVAMADRFVPAAIEPDAYVVASGFWRVEAIRPLLKKASQVMLLDEAMKWMEMK